MDVHINRSPAIWAHSLPVQVEETISDVPDMLWACLVALQLSRFSV